MMISSDQPSGIRAVLLDLQSLTSSISDNQGETHEIALSLISNELVEVYLKLKFVVSEISRHEHDTRSI